MRVAVLSALSLFSLACQEDLTETVATSVCESGTRWIGGNEESSNMNPGEACIRCHNSGEGPAFNIAGTVYDSSKQNDDCFGSVGATVVLTDAKGKVITMGLVSSGSFYSKDSFTPPYTAKVVRDGKETKMTTPQTNADCNSCHTVTGANGAPGRIVAP